MRKYVTTYMSHVNFGPYAYKQAIAYNKQKQSL